MKRYLTLLPFLVCHFLSADYFTEFIKYDAQPEFSRIVITNETIRGHRGVDHFSDNSKKYEKDNMFHTRYYEGGPKHIEKVETMDGHEVKCTLTIYPPSGHGYGGAVPWNFIQVYFDGELVLNSPIGYYHHSGSTIPKIVIHPQEQMLEVFCDKTEEGVFFGFIEHGDILLFTDGIIRRDKREHALPFSLNLTCQKQIDEITVIDEGTYPIVERKFKKLEKGEKRSFRVAGPFRVFCEDLLNLKFEVNGEEVARVKEEGEGNYRFDLVK